MPPLDPRPEDSPEEIIKQLENKVNTLLEESAEAASREDNQLVSKNNINYTVIRLIFVSCFLSLRFILHN